MPVRMPYMHLADTPCHVGRRPGDLQALLKAALVDSVDVVHPDRHPHALVTGFVAFRAERHPDGASAATALTVLAQKDLTIACADATEPGRTAPLPSLRPSELLEPSKALLYVGNVQNGCHLFHVHRIIPFSCNRDHNSVAPKSKDVARLKHDASSPGRYSFSPTLDTLIQYIGYHVHYEGTNREPRQSRHQLPHRQPRASTPNESRND